MAGGADRLVEGAQRQVDLRQGGLGLRRGDLFPEPPLLGESYQENTAGICELALGEAHHPAPEGVVGGGGTVAGKICVQILPP